MAAKVLSLSDAKSANISLIEDADRGRQAVHDVVVAYRANRRSGSANTKTRGEVAASGRKPYKQKGTGNARRGGNASPVTRGGGVAHGPRPRDYSKKVNKATKKLAFAKALSVRIADGDVLTVADLAIADGKTKTFVNEITNLVGSVRRVLVVADQFSEETKRSARNHQDSQLITADEVNTEQLLHYSKILVTEKALETLARRTAN